MEIPQLSKYYDKDNFHCKQLSKYLFYFKNYSKGKDDIYFKNILSGTFFHNNIEFYISYHIENLMNGEPYSHIINTCKEFNNLIKKDSYIDPDLTAEFPQLNKYYDKDNYHCK